MDTFLVLIEPTVHGDERGFFSETYRAEWHERWGIPAADRFIQVEPPLQAFVAQLGLEEQEEPVVEIGVVADRPGIEVEDQLPLEIGLPAR